MIPWLLATAVLLVSAAAPAQDAPSFDALDEILRDTVASADVPGAVLLVGRGDHILYHRAFGSRTVVPDP